MSPLTNPQAIHRVVQQSADLCEDNLTRCARQLAYLYNQRQDLAVQRQKRAERSEVEIAELMAICRSMGLEKIPA